MNGNTFATWEDVRKEMFTPEEIAESNLRVALIGELVKARKERGLSQKQLEELTGVKQPVIARMENGSTTPNLSTILKVLAPLGKTLYIGDLKEVCTERFALYRLFSYLYSSNSLCAGECSGEFSEEW